MLGELGRRLLTAVSITMFVAGVSAPAADAEEEPGEGSRWPYTVVAGDLDGDGLPDVLTLG